MYNNEFELEFEQALGNEQQEAGFGQEGSFEFSPELLGATQGETYELSGELSEAHEMELAHELLSVQNEQELNHFLGKLIRGAGKAIGGFFRSPIIKGLGGVLKTVAKKALPFAAGALGTMFGGPVGGMIGKSLGSMASNLFELELEGLSPEDQEFEVARAYVRFAHGAARHAAGLYGQRRGLPARQLLRQALTSSARQYAPGLLRPVGRPARPAGAFGGSSLAINQNGGYGAPAADYAAAPAGYGAEPGYGPEPGYPDEAAEPAYGGNPLPSRLRATRGTWVRQGRTLIIQL